MLKDRAKAQLYYDLSKLSAAGFPVIKAADTALDGNPPANQRQFLEDLKRGVAEGNSLSEAAGASAAGLTPLEISVLRASEESGQVPEGFGNLARYFEMRQRAASKIRRGLIYPGVLLHLAILLPAIPKAITSRDIKGTAIQTLMIFGVVYAAVLIGVVLFKNLSRKARTDTGADRLLRKFPLVGKVRHAFALSRFAEVLRIQTECGRGPLRGIRSAAAASGSASLVAAAKRHVLPEVEEGRRAGPGFIADKGKNFPGTFARGYATAEEAGGIDEEMERWSTAFADQAETAIDNLSAAAPKVIYGIVVIFVVYQIFNMALGYFDMIENMSKSL